uniref:uncharacterized protein LOC122591922 n=1 Tax=Erigeron canadensis TaxID=72917 RepID=UPI001CB98EBA|nr:uncharacterized protein LOC122591922 [Erigeron canadensis]
MSDIPKISFNLEYRSTQDDAWYTSGVILDHHNQLLRVKFKEFPEIQHDEVFSVSDFSSSDDVDEFRRRFRAETVPVEDNECTKVIEGMTVCAAYTEDGICRYFDAIVDAVYYKEHTHEKCVCNYLLVWQHGPGENNISATKLEDIYIIMTYAVDPTVAEFIKLVKDKLRGASSQFSLIPKSSSFSKKSSSSGTFNMSQARISLMRGPVLMLDILKVKTTFCSLCLLTNNDYDIITYLELFLTDREEKVLPPV